MRWVKKPIAAQMKRAQTNMTYVVDGNKCANIVPQGQYFQLINSTIAGRSDGVYTASKVIPANEVIDNTYFNQTTPISEGAINKINGELTALNSNLNSLANTTNDILADAFSVNGTKFFNGSGNSYTGDVPNANYKYGIFTVMRRWSAYFVVAHSADNEIAINYYNGSSWQGWKQLTSS